MEKTSITMSDEKKALKRSEITSAWSESTKVKASWNSPKSDPQKRALNRITSDTRRRDVRSISPTVERAMSQRRRRKIPDSAPLLIGLGTASGAGGGIMATTRGRRST